MEGIAGELWQAAPSLTTTDPVLSIFTKIRDATPRLAFCWAQQSETFVNFCKIIMFFLFGDPEIHSNDFCDGLLRFQNMRHTVLWQDIQKNRTFNGQILSNRPPNSHREIFVNFCKLQKSAKRYPRRLWCVRHASLCLLSTADAHARSLGAQVCTKLWYFVTFVSFSNFCRFCMTVQVTQWHAWIVHLNYV